MFPLIIMAASAIAGGYSNMQAADAAKKAARLNAFASRISTEFKIQDLRAAGRRLASSQRVAAAKSGVAIGSGSAAEVINDSAANVEKEIFRAKYAGELRAQGAQMDIDAYDRAGDNAMLAGFLRAGNAITKSYGDTQRNTVMN